MGLQKEIWRDVSGYEGKYQVSNFGHVKSLARQVWNGHTRNSSTINQKRGKTVKDYYQIDKDHDLNSLLEMGLIKDVASFYEGNIFKYVYRHRNKNGLEDLKKARNYLNLLMELEYGAETEDATTDEVCKWPEQCWKNTPEEQRGK